MIALAADLTFQRDLAGSLTPSVALAGNLSVGSSTVFDPSTVSNVTLTNGNLTASSTAVGGARSVDFVAKSAGGKYYYEIKRTANAPASLAGFADATAAYLSTDALTNGVQYNGNVTTGVTIRVSIGAWVANDVVCIAVDFTTNMLWARRNNGNWNNSGTANPATGVGGFAFAGTNVSPFAAFGAASEQYTLNAGATAYAQPVPAGFANWPAAGAIRDLAGALVPAVSFAADLTVATGAPGNYVDLAGNLGGVSSYGVRKYGAKKYSRVPAFEPIFAALALDIVGTDELAGDLRPVVTFAGALALTKVLAGDLTPTVALGGELTFDLLLEGGIAPQIDLGASLSLDLPLEGDFPVQIDLGASGLISGPLWAEAEPCPLPPWTATKPCSPPAWASSEPCPPPAWTSSEPPPSLWTPNDPCDPVAWEESDLCNG